MWLLPFFAVLRLLPRKPDLSQAPIRGGRLVSIIVPARNEAATIATLLRSIQQSSYRPFEVLVIDDRSTDETPAIVEEFARDDPRIRLIRGAELPAGWYGKPWACVQGYRVASGELLAFTDADTRHQPELLGHAVGALEEANADLVTPITRQVCTSFWERVIMPQIGLMLMLRYAPRVVNRAKSAGGVIANGQFILVRRDRYERVGTHERVRDQVAEDLALAQAFWRDGARLHLTHGEALIETRMYTSLKAVIEGWSKNLYLGSQTSFPDNPVIGRLAPVGLILGLCYWLLPVTWLILGAVGLVSSHVAAAAMATVLCAVFWIATTSAAGIPPWYGLTYPLGAIMSIYIIARSIWRGARAVEWRGRVYSGVEGGSGRLT